MLKNWNWKHYLAWAMFLAGFGYAGLTVVSNMPAGSSALSALVAVASFAAMGVGKFMSFVSNPPSDPVQAFQQGDGAASGVKKPNSAGFARLPLLFVLSCVGVVGAWGCGFFNHEAPVLKQDATIDVPCVLSAVLGGGSLAACGVTDMAQLGSILGDLIAYYDSQNAPADAGAAGALMVPFKGIPAKLTPDQLARLKAYAQTLHDAGK